MQTAENGEKALEVCESTTRVDVIIIDQNMESSGGRLLGHQVVANIRQNQGLSEVLIFEIYASKCIYNCFKLCR